MKAVVNGVTTTIKVKDVLEAAWVRVVQRSKLKQCNDCFKNLPQKKSLYEILSGPDIVLHCLDPKPGRDASILPEANTADRDIGINPEFLFITETAVLPCMLIHELAHIGGASTDAGASREVAHAAEKTLPSCNCKDQYHETVLGSIKILRTGGPAGSMYA
jgi:hypothetical protein